jgi:integrase
MARPRKPKYEYVEKLKSYRKRIKDADGKYVAIYAKTPEELTAKLVESQRLIEAATYNSEHPTLNMYADKWMAIYLPKVSQRTQIDYRYIIEHFIKAPLGHRRMTDITHDDIELALVNVNRKSESVYRKTTMLYKRIFNAAEESGVIEKSPCRKLTNGGVPQEEKVALTNEQIVVLLDAISTARTDIVPFVMIGLYAGLRREEILGLQWSNITLDGPAPHISIRTALRWEHNRPIVSAELKTPAARRDVPIPAQLVECLRAHKESSVSLYVFSDKDGQPKTESQFQNMWESVTTRMVKDRTYVKYVNGQKVLKTISPKKGEKAKCRNYCYTIDFHVSPHILRHTYITNLLLAGVDVKTVQYLAGHEKAKITMDIYAHLTYNRPEDIISKINRAFEVKNEVKTST